MPNQPKKTKSQGAKSQITVKDLKPSKNPKGGASPQFSKVSAFKR